jgi:hypothetical protein
MLYKRGITLNAIVQHFISCFMSELDPDIMVKDTWIPVGHLMFFPFVYIVTTSNFNTKILQLKTRQREIFIRLLIMYNSLKAYSCIHVHTLMKVYHLFYLNSTLDVWRLKSRWDNLIFGFPKVPNWYIVDQVKIKFRIYNTWSFIDKKDILHN